MTLHQHWLGKLLALLLLLCCRCFSCYKNAFPRLKKWIIYQRGKSDIAALEQTSSDISPGCDKSAYSHGNGKWLHDHWHMDPAYREHNIVDCDDQCWDQHEWDHHDGIQRHWHAECDRF